MLGANFYGSSTIDIDGVEGGALAQSPIKTEPVKQGKHLTHCVWGRTVRRCVKAKS